MKAPSNRTARFLATAVTTGLAATAGNAAVVQISLLNNTFTTTGGNQLFSDLTGDGTSDLIFASAHAWSNAWAGTLGIKINGGPVFVVAASTTRHSVKAGFLPNSGMASGQTPLNVTAYNLITLNDARINGGATTQAYLEVNARNLSMHDQQLSLLRVVFDDASTTISKPAAMASPSFSEFSAVPEPSGLALLALGAGGLLTRRRRLAAA